MLGWIINDSFDGKVRVVQRGSRKSRQRAYLNLRRKRLQVLKDDCIATDGSSYSCITSLQNLQIPGNWHSITDRHDQVSFIRHENWEFCGQRGTTELLVKETKPHEVSLTAKSHCSTVDLKNNLKFDNMFKDTPIEEQILLAMNYIDQSSLCFGFQDDDDCVLTTLPHVTGILQELYPVENQSKRVFAHNCLVLSGSGGICANCARLRLTSANRKRRKENQPVIHPKCNKRFMNKEEVQLQLKMEQTARYNAEKREQYWREKFKKECVDVVHDDQEDLLEMFAGVQQKDVPENMQCLWQQQEKIHQTKSKNGYRWHPK